MVTLNSPQKVFELLSHRYSVLWSQILKMSELSLNEFNKILKGKLTLVVVLDI